MQRFNSRDPIINIGPFPAIIGGCIIGRRLVRAAFDNINARGVASGQWFGRMALDGEVRVQGQRGSRDRAHSR